MGKIMAKLKHNYNAFPELRTGKKVYVYLA